MSDDRTSIHLNLSPREDLEGVKAISGRASAVIANRPYQNWSDLRRAGLSSDDIDRIKASGVGLGEAAEGPIGEPGSGGSAEKASGNLGRA
ncbi:hypothetical protein [Brevundimonas sp.]|jgi:hypothetical protein|uniref:hypothetical protein n=1 Tax=Brevundimonas sp. TaxID=1871086 RepID=UPI00185E7C0A|nr:hypothetical protein [Brevundimonas sp.]MBA4806677.1 hypothetical protein [Brevundimonas sp.]